MRRSFAKAVVAAVYLLVVLLFLATSLNLNAWQSPEYLEKHTITPRLDPLVLHMKSEASREKASPALAEQNEIELRLEVQRLYALSSELKDEVNATDSRAFLNTAVLRRVQDIEKLAKQIRDHARR